MAKTSALRSVFETTGYRRKLAGPAEPLKSYSEGAKLTSLEQKSEHLLQGHIMGLVPPFRAILTAFR